MNAIPTNVPDLSDHIADPRSSPLVLRVLAITGMYPTQRQPHSGTFVKSQIESLQQVNVQTTVLHLTGRSPWKYVWGIWQVWLAADPKRFDLVHAHYGYCGLVARVQWKLPVVVSFCGDDLLGTPDGRGNKTFTSRLAVVSNLFLSRMVNGIIVKSEEMCRVLPKSLRTPIDVIPNGVDFDRFKPVPRAEARQRLRLAPDRRYVIFPADPAIPRKAFPIADAAVQQLRGEGLPVDIVAVHGKPQTEVVDYINAADVVALPSYWEGSPNVVKEAMACNVPIVAAEVGDVREIIGQTAGCAVAERTPEAFATAIRAALEIPDGRTDGRRRIRRLSLPAVAAQVRAVYARALGSHIDWQAHPIEPGSAP